MVYPGLPQSGPPQPRPEEIWPFQHPHHFNAADYEGFLFDHTSEKTVSKIPPPKEAKLSEPVKTPKRAKDSDSVRHVTYRDVQLSSDFKLH